MMLDLREILDEQTGLVQLTHVEQAVDADLSAEFVFSYEYEKMNEYDCMSMSIRD